MCTSFLPVYKWIRGSGKTSSSLTGPTLDADGSITGSYLYTEASHGSHGDATAVSFPEFLVTGSDKNLQFFYHMYGQDVGSLMLQAHKKSDGSMTTLWSRSGGYGDQWRRGLVDVSHLAGETIQFNFVAVRGQGPLGDIAIDSIGLVTKQDPSIRYDIPSLTSRMYQYIRMPCIVENKDTSSTVKWYRVNSDSSTTLLTSDETVISSATVTGSNATKYSMMLEERASLSTYTLGISDIQYTDQGDYRCVLERTGVASDSWKSATGKLRVLSAVSCDFESGDCDYRRVYPRYDPTGNGWQRLNRSWTPGMPDHTNSSSWNTHYFATSFMDFSAGRTSILATPFSRLQGTERLTFYYFTRGLSNKLKVAIFDASHLTGYADMTEYFESNIHDINSSVIDILWSTSEDTLWQWTGVCINIEKSYDNVTFLFIFDEGLAALDDVSLERDDKCKKLNEYMKCDFMRDELCGFTLEDLGNCTRYYGSHFAWQFGPTSFINYTPSQLYVNHSNGISGDVATVNFQGFPVVHGFSLRLHYMGAMNSKDLAVHLTSSSGRLSVYNIERKIIRKEGLLCIDIMENDTLSSVKIVSESSRLSFHTVSIQSFEYIHGACEEKTVNCTFDDDFICGYEGFGWNRTEEESFLKAEFGVGYSTNNSIWSPLVTMPTSQSCVMLKYQINASAPSQPYLSVIIEDSESGMEYNVTVTRPMDWTPLHIQTDMTSFYVHITSGSNFYYNSISYFVAVDDVMVTSGTCPPVECTDSDKFACVPDECLDSDKFACVPDGMCLDRELTCNREMDCSDGSDESRNLCKNSITCDFGKAFICGYQTDGQFTNDTTDSYGAIAFSTYRPYEWNINKLVSPQEEVPTDSCFRFETKGVSQHSYRVVQKEVDGSLSEIAYYSGFSLVWKERRINITGGNLSFIFEDSALLYHPYGFRYSPLYIDNVILDSGFCPPLSCNKDEFYCMEEDVCIPGDSECDQIIDCMFGEDERNCYFNITCDFDEKSCGYRGDNFDAVQEKSFSDLNVTDLTDDMGGQFYIAGDSDGEYVSNLTSPRLYLSDSYTLSFYVGFVHQHPYSTSYVTVTYSDSYSSSEISDIREFFVQPFNWTRYDVNFRTYGTYSINFQVTGYKSHVCIDDVKLSMQSRTSVSTTFPSAEPYNSSYTTSEPTGEPVSEPSHGNSSYPTSEPSPEPEPTPSSEPREGNSTNNVNRTEPTGEPESEPSTVSQAIGSNSASRPSTTMASSDSVNSNSSQSSSSGVVSTVASSQANGTSSPSGVVSTMAASQANGTSSPSGVVSTVASSQANGTSSPSGVVSTVAASQANGTSSPIVGPQSTASSDQSFNSTQHDNTTRLPPVTTNSFFTLSSSYRPYENSTLYPNDTGGNTTDGCLMVNHYLCRGYGYTKTLLPNIIGHRDLWLAETYVSYFERSLSWYYQCYQRIMKLACGLLVPKCDAGNKTEICRQSCLDIFDTLLDPGSQCYSYSTAPSWKRLQEHYCMFLPITDCISINATETNLTTGAPPNSTYMSSTYIPYPTTDSGVRVRLVPFDSEVNRGIVEVFKDGLWRRACHSSFYDLESSLACQAMGYGGGYTYSYYYQTSGDFVDVYCYSDHTDFSQCYIYTDSYCSNNWVAIAFCFVDTATCDFDNNRYSCGYSYDLSSWSPGYGYMRYVGGLSPSSPLRVPRINTGSASSLTFSFKVIEGAGLNVVIQNADNNEEKWESYEGYPPGIWIDTCLDLPINSNIDVKFVGSSLTFMNSGSVFIDGAQLRDEACPAPFPVSPCTFEDRRKCPFEIQCSAIVDPKPFQWRLTVDVSNFTDSNDTVLMANATHGELGDKTEFTLDINVSSLSYMRVYYMINPGKYRSSSLQITFLPHEGSTTPLTAWESSGEAALDWQSTCIPLQQFATGNTGFTSGKLTFIATRGYEYYSNVAVTKIDISGEACPHFASCTFDSSRMCEYSVVSDSGFSWEFGLSGYRTNGRPMYDHTTRSGGFAYTQTCTPDWEEGDKTDLTTPTFQTDASGMRAMFNFHMHGKDMGVFKTKVNWYEGSEWKSDVKLTVAGDQGSQWYLACVEIPANQNKASVSFSAEHGDGCFSTMAVDDVMLEVGNCPRPLTDRQCRVEEPFMCQYESNCTEGSTYQWTRGMGPTPSTRTGPEGDADGDMYGHFLFVDGSDGKPGHQSYVWFPSVTLGSTPSLHFWYHMWGADVGSLAVLRHNVQSGATSEIWRKTGNQLNIWHWGCVDLAANPEEVQILFEATRGDGFESDIAIDNIAVRNIGCPVLSATCNFDDEFVCLYENRSSTDSGWRQVSHMDQRYKTSVQGLSGSYMRPIHNETATAAMISPEFNHSQSTCVRFEYFAYSPDWDVFTYQQLPGMSIGLHSSSSLLRRVKWETKTTSSPSWTVGQFQFSSEVSPGNHRLVFEAYNSSLPAEIAIDNVTVSEGSCEPLVCSGDLFSCTDRCLPISSVCDKIVDCGDMADESVCNRSISCNFEDDYHCGYINSSFRNVMFKWSTNLTASSVYPYVIRARNTAVSGHFLGYRADYEAVFPRLRSPAENITTDSCLSLHYIANSYLAVDVIDGLTHTKKFTFMTTHYSNTSLAWQPTQVRLPPGYVYMEFYFPNHTSRYNQYGAIDDIVLTSGPCGELDCGSGRFECDPGVCFPNSVKCNRIRDCLTGKDELGCNFTVSCDFEKSNICGYGLNSPFLRRGSNYLYRPMFDNTYGDERGHYVYYESKTQDFVSLTSPTEDLGEGCLSFHYNMEGGVATELKVHVINNGTRTLGYFANGVHIERDEWVEGQVPIAAGEVAITFEAMVGPKSWKPSVIALDDIVFREGDSCPKKENCSEDEFWCAPSRICIPAYLVRDGISDCYDGSDEAVPVSGTRPGEIPARLVGGKDRSYGRVEVLFSPTSSFKAVCERDWAHQYESQALCRQLGYRAAVRTFNASYFGASRTQEYLGYTFSCGSSSSYLNDSTCRTSTLYSSCAVGDFRPAYHSHIGVACSNSTCMYGERPCQPGTSGTKCVPEASWCDGIRDCLEGDDERDCANCTSTEWECLSHQCIPEIQRCDGTPQCPDQSDEFQCVKHTNASGEVEVRHSGNQVGILCADNIDRGTADYLCSQSGSGQYLSHFQSYVVSNGLVAIPSENNPGIIPHRRLQQVSSCYSLGLRCGTIECGVPITSLLETFVLFGSDAQQGEWPWQISIMRNGGHICGGTIISPDWIVTAAHCVDDYSASNYDVGAGSLVKNQAYISGQVRSVQSKYIHPNYSLPDTNPSHTDLALLRLSSPLRFDNNTRPACIGHSVEDLRNCYVTGWGYTYYDESRNSVSPTILQEEHVQILNHGECRSNWYNTTGFRYTYVQDDVLCVDNREPFGSLCYGDSGGPLVCQNQRGRWELMGVTSRGYPGCTVEFYLPSLYTSLPHNLNWIRSTSGLDIYVPFTPAPQPSTDPPNIPPSSATVHTPSGATPSSATVHTPSGATLSSATVHTPSGATPSSATVHTPSGATPSSATVHTPSGATPSSATVHTPSGATPSTSQTTTITTTGGVKTPSIMPQTGTLSTTRGSTPSTFPPANTPSTTRTTTPSTTPPPNTPSTTRTTTLSTTPPANTPSTTRTTTPSTTPPANTPSTTRTTTPSTTPPANTPSTTRTTTPSTTPPANTPSTTRTTTPSTTPPANTPSTTRTTTPSATPPANTPSTTRMTTPSTTPPANTPSTIRTTTPPANTPSTTRTTTPPTTPPANTPSTTRTTTPSTTPPPN